MLTANIIKKGSVLSIRIIFIIIVQFIELFVERVKK